jgi:pilus assembly protein Flp/PilA
MRTKLSNLYASFRGWIRREEGQDLVEYALVVALIGFAATAGMNSLASAINTLFTNVGTTLTSIG